MFYDILIVIVVLLVYILGPELIMDAVLKIPDKLAEGTNILAKKLIGE